MAEDGEEEGRKGRQRGSQRESESERSLKGHAGEDGNDHLRKNARGLSEQRATAVWESGFSSAMTRQWILPTALIVAKS